MRRKIISATCIAVVLIFAASCSKVEKDRIAKESNGRTVITAVAEAVGKTDAKAHNQYSYDVLWDEGDKIYVTGGGKSNTFTVSDESAGTSKDFNGEQLWDFDNDRVDRDIVLFPKWERLQALV